MPPELLQGDEGLEKLYLFAVGLLAFSIPFTAVSFLVVASIPLTALGIGLMILASSILLTPIRSLPPQAVRAMLEGSVSSLEAILEEFGISRRGYYVRAPDGRIYLYVPINEDSGPPAGAGEPSGLVYREGSLSYLVLVPPAAELVKTPELSAMSFESAVSYVLVDLMEVADSVEVVTDGFITLRLKGVKSHVSASRFKEVFGSLEASIAACIAANLIGVTRVVDELEEGDDKVMVLEVWER